MRAARKAQKVSAVAAAEATGLSRVTLHRIERGEPGVAIGHWLAVAETLGLRLTLESIAQGRSNELPSTVRLANYPALRQLAWHTPGVAEMDPAEALAMYERNWRHVDQHALSSAERDLIARLARAFGHGRLLV